MTRPPWSRGRWLPAALVAALAVSGAACSSGAPGGGKTGATTGATGSTSSGPVAGTSGPVSTTGPTGLTGPSGPSAGQLPGLNTGPAPWPPESRFLPQRLRAIGLPPLGPEATRVHFHVDLVVDVLGRKVPVPYGIGIDFRRGTLAEIHTHAGRGTIHIEAARPKPFTLGMVFDVWGVRFTPECIGGYCDDGTNTIRVFLDGQPYSGDPTTLALANEQAIVVAYGTEEQLPKPMPAKFVYEGPPKPA